MPPRPMSARIVRTDANIMLNPRVRGVCDVDQQAAAFHLFKCGTNAAAHSLGRSSTKPTVSVSSILRFWPR